MWIDHGKAPQADGVNPGAMPTAVRIISNDGLGVDHALDIENVMRTRRDHAGRGLCVREFAQPVRCQVQFGDDLAEDLEADAAATIRARAPSRPATDNAALVAIVADNDAGLAAAGGGRRNNLIAVATLLVANDYTLRRGCGSPVMWSCFGRCRNDCEQCSRKKRHDKTHGVLHVVDW